MRMQFNFPYTVLFRAGLFSQVKKFGSENFIFGMGGREVREYTNLTDPKGKSVSYCEMWFIHYDDLFSFITFHPSLTLTR